MIRYTLTRLALLLLGLLVASVLIFLTLRVLPGDIAQLIAGSNSTPEQIAVIRERLGLNQPLPAQYLDWMGGVFRGDLGSSLLTGSSVTSELAQKAQVTVPLGIMSLTIAILFSIPLGVVSAMRRRRGGGTALSVGAQALAAVPVVWAGMMLVVVFAVWLGWLPAQGFPRAGWTEPAAAFRSLLLPALTIGIVEGAMLMRFVRSATMQAVGQDYVRTAAAKGLTRNTALIRHGLPNVGLSVVTGTGGAKGDASGRLEGCMGHEAGQHGAPGAWSCWSGVGTLDSAPGGAGTKRGAPWRRSWSRSRLTSCHASCVSP